MHKQKGKGQIVHTSISMRLGVREMLDSLGDVIKENTGVEANRSKLITILTNLAHEARGAIDYGEVHDETTLQRELAQAIVRRYGGTQEHTSEEV